ncbi:hypothetical protein F4824DRAFT_459725 [Ustulina deusta]|nr:hypothetical protein F4824DRAFT_459725 [Ustulina deusta]
MISTTSERITNPSTLSSFSMLLSQFVLLVVLVLTYCYCTRGEVLFLLASTAVLLIYIIWAKAAI